MKSKRVSATEAKMKFGTLMDQVKDGSPLIIEKNNRASIVWISIDDFEDYLEINDVSFQKSVIKAQKEIKNGDHATLDDLYSAHRKTIVKEAE